MYRTSGVKGVATAFSSIVRLRGGSLLLLPALLLGSTPLLFHLAFGHAAPGEPPRHATSTPDTLRLVSGSPGGLYYPLGRAIAKSVAAVGLTIVPISSPGSIANLDSLQAGRADLGLVQSDMLPGTGDSLVYPVLSICNEDVHVVSRPGLYITSFSQIAHKNVFLGLQGSGSRRTALSLLGAAGISHEEITEVPARSYDEAITSLTEGKADIGFFTFALPAPVLTEPLSSRRLRLIPIDEKLLKRFTQQRSSYVLTYIPRDTYHTDSSVLTAGVRTVLVASAGVPPHEISFLMGRMLHEWPAISREVNIESTLDFHRAKWGIQGTFHPGAVSYYRSHRLRILASHIGLSWLLIVLISGTVVYLLLRRRHQMLRFLWHRPLLLSVSLVFLVWFMGSVGMYAAERRINENFDPITDALWSVVIYLISGFEDRMPITQAGRAITILTMIGGAAALTFVTGSVAALLTRHGLETNKMPKRMSGHFVICNWDLRAFTIIHELRNIEPGDPIPIVVLADDAANTRFHGRKEDDRYFEDVYKVSGSPTDERALRRANAQDARCVIVLASEDATGDVPGKAPGRNGLRVSADARSLMTLLALRKISTEHELSFVHTVVEILDPKNVEMAHNISGDDNWVEVVSAPEIETRLIAQSAYTPGLVGFYRDLLSFTEDTNEIYSIPVPQSHVGQTFRECLLQMVRNAPSDFPIIPVGVQRAGRLLANPRTDITLSQDDRLIVVAYEEPKVRDLKRL
jgi:voltage-gated potassium channel